MAAIRLIVIDPGHFHGALVQKEMYPNVAPTVHVYAPVSLDLVDYVTRIARFNTRAESPTRWALEVHAGADFLARLAREQPGTVAILSGRNRDKIAKIEAAIESGLHVLADKPWIIRREDLPRLERVLAAATAKRLIAMDMMAGRHEVTNALQRALHQDPAVFGKQVAGSAAAPGVAMTSVHHIMKQVAGAPNPRPPWFFDVGEQGEALSDVGTHMIDRVHLTLFPEQAVDWRRDVVVHQAERWPTMVTATQFRQVTGETRWPDYLAPAIEGDALAYRCNTRLAYSVRGIHVGFDLRWNWQAEPGGDDSHTAVYRGSRARLELRHGAAEGWRPELYVVPEADIAGALERRIAALQAEHPGIGLERRGAAWHIHVPDALRIGHDAHFAALARDFLQHVEQGRPLDAWEEPAMLAKYFVSTAATAGSAA